MVEPNSRPGAVLPGDGVTGGSARGPGRARQIATALAAVGAALLASLCCIGPLLFVTLGVGAGLASRFEPLRPYFTVLTIVLLAIGFYTVYGRRRAAPGDGCAADRACAVDRHPRRDRTLLWGAAVIALLVLTFPQWSLLFV